MCVRVCDDGVYVELARRTDLSIPPPHTGNDAHWCHAMGIGTMTANVTGQRGSGAML